MMGDHPHPARPSRARGSPWTAELEATAARRKGPKRAGGAGATSRRAPFTHAGQGPPRARAATSPRPEPPPKPGLVPGPGTALGRPDWNTRPARASTDTQARPYGQRPAEQPRRPRARPSTGPPRQDKNRPRPRHRTCPARPGTDEPPRHPHGAEAQRRHHPGCSFNRPSTVDPATTGNTITAPRPGPGRRPSQTRTPPPLARCPKKPAPEKPRPKGTPGPPKVPPPPINEPPRGKPRKPAGERIRGNIPPNQRRAAAGSGANRASPFHRPSSSTHVPFRGAQPQYPTRRPGGLRGDQRHWLHPSPRPRAGPAPRWSHPATRNQGAWGDARPELSQCREVYKR